MLPVTRAKTAKFMRYLTTSKVRVLVVLGGLVSNPDFNAAPTTVAT
jgi:hypothetical protein